MTDKQPSKKRVRRPHKDLFRACAERGTSLELIRHLLAKGCDPKRTYHASVKSGFDEVNALLAHTAKGDADPEIIEALVQAGAPVDEPSERYGMTPLHGAAAQNQVPAIECLLRLGADVHRADKSGDAALHFAAEADASEAITALVAHGADGARSYNGWFGWSKSALWKAAARDSLQALAALLDTTNPNEARLHAPAIHTAYTAGVIQLLAARGADLDRAYENTTALINAAAQDSVDRAGWLLDAGALPDRFAGGRGPLHEAVKVGSVAMVAFLLGRGADPDLPDADGESALSRARQAGSPVIRRQFVVDEPIPRERPAQLVGHLLRAKRVISAGTERFVFGGRSVSVHNPHFESQWPRYRARTVGWAEERCAWLLLFGGDRAGELQRCLSGELERLGCEPYEPGEAVQLLRDNEPALVARLDVTLSPHALACLVRDYLLGGGEYERGNRECFSGWGSRDGQILRWDGESAGGRANADYSEYTPAEFVSRFAGEFRERDGLLVLDHFGEALLSRALEALGLPSARSALQGK